MSETERPLKPQEIRAIMRANALRAQAAEAIDSVLPQGAEVNLETMTLRYLRPEGAASNGADANEAHEET